MWLDVVLAHVVEELTWDLLKDFFGKQLGISLEVVEWHELNDIGCHVSSEASRVKCLLVTVENLHRFEVSVTYADDDDSNGEV